MEVVPPRRRLQDPRCRRGGVCRILCVGEGACSGDARFLPVKYDGGGSPYRPVQEAVDMLQETSIRDFVARGTRTVAYRRQWRDSDWPSHEVQERRAPLGVRLGGERARVTQQAHGGRLRDRPVGLRQPRGHGDGVQAAADERREVRRPAVECIGAGRGRSPLLGYPDCVRECVHVAGFAGVSGDGEARGGGGAPQSARGEGARACPADPTADGRRRRRRVRGWNEEEVGGLDSPPSEAASRLSVLAGALCDNAIMTSSRLVPCDLLPLPIPSGGFFAGIAPDRTASFLEEAALGRMGERGHQLVEPPWPRVTSNPSVAGADICWAVRGA